MLRSIKRVPPTKIGNITVQDREYYRFVLGVDRRFNANHKAARIAARIEVGIEDAGDYDPEKPATPIMLAEADWEVFKEAIENPQPIEGAQAYPTTHAYKYVPFGDAVVDAAEVKNAAIALPEETNGSAKTAQA